MLTEPHIFRTDGIYYVDHDAAGGAELFRAACKLGIEGIVSKRAARRYNKKAQGYLRVRDGMDG